jgi:hypothetical protein
VNLERGKFPVLLEELHWSSYINHHKAGEWFDARVAHEWARKARYQHGDIEPELTHRLDAQK